MGGLRSSNEGVANIVRFNWPFFVSTGVGIGLVLLVGSDLGAPWSWLALVASVATVLPMLWSLLISYAVYDCSGLYDLDWLEGETPKSVINIHAGFDETSLLLSAKYPRASLRVFDFYDPSRHTEASIRRARSRYPAYPGTEVACTDLLPSSDGEADLVLFFFSAHEVRDATERGVLFAEASRLLAPEGRIVVVEHLRDLPNFLAYSIGFCHFHSYHAWRQTFAAADLEVVSEQKFTPFLSIFTLEPNACSRD